MFHSKDCDVLIDVMNEMCDEITRMDGKTTLNFMVQMTVLKIGKYPSKIDRVIHNAETEAQGYILIQSILN